ncbi:MAG: DUF4199 domain-containing protein [Bacteroidetes bacterium]|nr:MAG: DUF4199 domain-containing protein [Bacteroidota bacterium]
MKRIVIGAVLTGVIIVIKMMVEYYFGIHSDKLHIAPYFVYLRYVIFLAAYLLVFYKIPFKGFKDFTGKGLVFFAIVAMIVGVGHFVYHSAINPDFEEDYKKFLIEKVEQNQEMKAEHKEIKIKEIEKRLKEYHWMNTPVGAMIFYFVETFIVGILYTLIGSWAFRKRKT